MELIPSTDSGRQVVSHEEYASSESSASQTSKQIGNTKINQQSSNFLSDESSHTVEKSATSSATKLVQSSVTSSKSEELNEETQTVPDEKDAIEEAESGKQSKGLEILTKYIEDTPEESKQEIARVGETKRLINRQTSTTSLEEENLKNLHIKSYRQIEDLVFESLPSQLFVKEKRPISVPPAEMFHLLQSIKITQELNRVLADYDSNKENEQDGDNSVTDEGEERTLNKPIDLEKLFTPASDSGEGTPSRRKMFASSSFYSPNHPTVQDQVELARRISSSLCDISNRQSKGQSMYVNRMKRSVKWVHGGEKEQHKNGLEEVNEEKTVTSSYKYVGKNESNVFVNDSTDKPVLKLIMNPAGKIQDINSLDKQGHNVQTPLTPELCFDLVRDLNATKGKGAELFAKRRKKSEKWVVDENTVKQSSSSSLQQQTTTTTTSSSEKTVVQTQQRQQQLQKLHEVQERLNQPRLKLLKSPWEAALETGSVDTAFQELGPVFPKVSPPPPTPAPSWTSTITSSETNIVGNKSDLYKPNIPKGWTNSQSKQLTYGLNNLAPSPFGGHQTPLPAEVNILSTSGHSSLAPTPAPSRLDYNCLNNFNTAPRGWKQNLEYYRPVTFTPSSKVPHSVHYTDY